MEDKWDAFRNAMEGFMRGEWTLEMPQKPGSYPVYARHSQCSWHFHGIINIYEDPKTGEMKSTTNWGGWWWSEPFPPFPPTPDHGKMCVDCGKRPPALGSDDRCSSCEICAEVDKDILEEVVRKLEKGGSE